MTLTSAFLSILLAYNFTLYIVECSFFSQQHVLLGGRAQLSLSRIKVILFSVIYLLHKALPVTINFTLEDLFEFIQAVVRDLNLDHRTVVW